MIRSLTLSSFVALALTAHAQPVLTFTDNAPMPGQSYILRYSPFVDPGASGANQTWDLSSLVTDSLDNLLLVDPTTTMNGASFPTATVAETGADAIMYWRSAADGMYLTGSDAGDALIPYSDEGRYLPYPCAYLDNWNDSVASQFDIQGIQVDRAGFIEGEADGHGTLIMPTWSVTDVLRVHWHEETTDAAPLFDVVSLYDSYLYFVVGQSYPIVQVVHTEVTILGQTEVHEHAQWVDELSTYAREMTSSTEGLTVYPVPANDVIRVTLPRGMRASTLLSIIDANGRTMTTLSAGDALSGIDISGLAPGIYQITANDGNAARRFIVN